VGTAEKHQQTARTYLGHERLLDAVEQPDQPAADDE
jgi:hypothetical protein